MANADLLFRIEAQAGDTLETIKAVEKRLREMEEATKSASHASKEQAAAERERAQAIKQEESAVRKAEKAARDHAAAMKQQQEEAGASASTIGGQLNGAISKLGPTIIAAFSVAKVVQFGKAAVAAAAEAEDSVNRVRSALAATGSAGMTRQLTELAGALQETTRYSDDAIMSMQAMALRIGVPASAMQDFTKAAVNMASALQMDVGEAGEHLAKTFDGDANKLKQLIPEFANLDEAALKAGQGIDVVAQKFRGAATADAQSLGGSLANLKNQWGELQEATGAAIVELGNVSGATSGLAGYIKNESIPAVREWAEGWGIAIDGIKGAWSSIQDFMDKAPALKAVLSSMWSGFRPLSRDGWITKGIEYIVSRGADLSGAKFGPQAGAGSDDDAAAAAEGEAYRKMRADQMRAGEDRRRRREEKMNDIIEEARKRSEAAAKEREDIARNVAAYEGAAAAAQKHLQAALSIATTDAQRGDLLNSIAGELDAAQKAGWDLVKSGNITRESYEGTNEQIRIMQRELLSAGDAAAEASRRAQAEREALTARDVESGNAAGLNVDAELDVQQTDVSSEIYQQQNAQRQQELADKQELLDLEQRLLDQGMSSADVASAVAEATLRQAEAHGDVASAMDRQAMANDKMIAAGQKASEQAKEATARQVQFRQATIASAMALVQEAMAGKLSFRSLLAAGLQYLSQWASQKAAMNFAAAAEQAGVAASMAAMNNYKGAAEATASSAQHMTAGTLWSVLGGAAGAAAGAVNSGGGSGGGGGRDSAAGGLGGDMGDDFRSTSRNRDAAEDIRRGPNVSVVFTGNGIIAGTTPEAFASAVTPFIQEVIRESGGRDSSVRG